MPDRPAARARRVRARMDALGVDALLLSTGADLPWLVGYEATPLERLTMLVLPRVGDARLVVPRLEAPRVHEQPGLFEVIPWEETEDPVALVATLAGNPPVAAIGDHTWARFLLALQREMPSTAFRPASEVVGPVRAVKDASEIAALKAAAHAVDQVAVEMRYRPFANRPEIEVAREISERMRAHGHQRINFAIVAAAENAASPHHSPGTRLIREGEVVLCDFGGVLDGYCSDITRMFHVGEPPAEVTETYAVLVDAQEQAVRAAKPGTRCEDVDAAARGVIAAAGYGDLFVHRTGHGIGVEAHEDPYLVAGNREPLAAGAVFSIEPGIYVPGRFGLRLEDIVVATERGPERLNGAPRDLPVVG